jgi:hypothetical protein
MNRLDASPFCCLTGVERLLYRKQCSRALNEEMS